MITRSNIFKTSSNTYYYSHLFFPKEIKKDVFTLYSFFRKIDDLIDNLPQDKKRFLKIKNAFIKDKPLIGDNEYNQFLFLINKYKIKKSLTNKFFRSMSTDLSKKEYLSQKEITTYMEGSAEVIGIIISKILNLNSKAYVYAKLLGRSMQYLNFIRDINEDLSLGRTYFPKSELKKFNLNSLDYQYILSSKKNYIFFIHAQINIFNQWVKKAECGYTYIPLKYLIAIKTSTDMYKWTAKKIQEDPFIVYRKKVKPSKFRVLLTGFINAVSLSIKAFLS